MISCLNFLNKKNRIILITTLKKQSKIDTQKFIAKKKRVERISRLKNFINSLVSEAIYIYIIPIIFIIFFYSLSSCKNFFKSQFFLKVKKEGK